MTLEEATARAKSLMDQAVATPDFGMVEVTVYNSSPHLYKEIRDTKWNVRVETTIDTTEHRTVPVEKR
jgi:hypothetical protein